MNKQDMQTKVQSLINRLDAAIEHDQPETFAFTIGVQLGAFRSRVRREMRSTVSKSKLEQSLLESLDDRCFYIESEMIEAMALTRELTKQRDHLKNAAVAAELMAATLQRLNRK